MSELRVDAVNMNFNAAVQTMRAKYAPNYKVRPDAEVFAEYQKEQFLKNGHVVVSDVIDENHIFGSDGIAYDFAAWLVSCRIRVVSRYGHVSDDNVFQAMCRDLYDVYGFDAQVAIYCLILHILLVRRPAFFRKYDFYPEPTKQWMRDELAVSQKEWIHTFKGEPD